MAYSTGYSAGGRLLGGLSKNPNVAAFGKAKAMSSAAGLGMQKASDDQSMALDQMQEDSQQRMRQAGNAATRASNESQQRIQEGNLNNRRSVFDMGMSYDYASQRRKKDMDFRQMLFDGLTRDF